MKAQLLFLGLLFVGIIANANTDSTQISFVDSLQQNAADRGGYVYDYEMVEKDGICYHTFSGWKCYVGGTVVIYTEEGALLYHVNSYNYSPQPKKAIDKLDTFGSLPYVSLNFRNWFFIDSFDYPIDSTTK